MIKLVAAAGDRDLCFLMDDLHTHTPGSCLILLLTFCDNWKVMVQVESMEGVEAIPEIAKVPGVDGIFLGKRFLEDLVVLHHRWLQIFGFIFSKSRPPVSNYNRPFRLVL